MLIKYFKILIKMLYKLTKKTSLEKRLQCRRQSFQPTFFPKIKHLQRNNQNHHTKKDRESRTNFTGTRMGQRECRRLTYSQGWCITKCCPRWTWRAKFEKPFQNGLSNDEGREGFRWVSGSKVRKHGHGLSRSKRHGRGKRIARKKDLEVDW